MNRRQFMAVIGAGVFAGCTGRSASPASSDSPTDAPTTDTPTESPTGQSPSSRLVIWATVDTALNVTLKLIDLSDKRVVYDQMQTVDSGDMIRLDDHFEPGADYRFTMEIGDREVFEREIYSYAGYEVTIRSKAIVEVTGQTEI